jgi:hypothetical protein
MLHARQKKTVGGWQLAVGGGDVSRRRARRHSERLAVGGWRWRRFLTPSSSSLVQLAVGGWRWRRFSTSSSSSVTCSRQPPTANCQPDSQALSGDFVARAEVRFACPEACAWGLWKAVENRQKCNSEKPCAFAIANPHWGSPQHGRAIADANELRMPRRTR